MGPSGAHGEVPRAGYYPDPSIPGYIRYWNGTSWVPGTSRPEPREGEPMPAPPPVASSPATAPTPPATAGQEGPAGPPARPRRSPSDETGPVFLDADADADAGTSADAGTGSDGVAAPADAGPGAGPAGGRADVPAQAGFGPPADPRGGWGTDAPSGGTAPVPAATPTPTPEGVNPAASGGREHTVGLRRSDVLGSGRRTGTADAPPTPGADSAADRAADSAERGGATAVPGQRPGEPGQAGPGRANPAQDRPGPAGPTVTSGSALGRAEAGEQGAPARGAAAADVPPAGPSEHGGQGGPAASGQGVGNPPAAGQQATTGPAASPATAAPAEKPAPTRVEVPSQGQGQGQAQPQAQAQPQPQAHASGRLVPRQEPAPALPGQREASGVPGQGPGHGAPAQAGAVSPVRADGAAAQGAVAPSWSQPAPSGSPAHQQAAHQQVAGLPAQPPSGGPDAVTPWRPPVDDPFSRMAEQEARPAALGRRLGARLVDLVLTLAVGAAAAFPFVGKAVDHIEAKIDAVEQAGVTRQVWLVDGTTGGYLALVLGVLVVFGLLYEMLPTARWGRTFGKKLFGICVVNIEGYGKPGFAKSLLRWLVHGALGVLVIGVVNVVWCLFDRPWRQCWHDKVAGTFVAKGDTSAELRL
ncbi:RDD family protein [Streptomyces diacarni]|uniref:RDD family protein n=1 Tax=Streptomyces diacarni TaxID=2800381 RepID=UPI0033E54ED5